MSADMTTSLGHDQNPKAAAYHAHAHRYDHRTRAFAHWRELLVAELPAKPGDTVLDVGCGTGLCLPPLRDKVGQYGHIVGVDASADMLELARARVRQNGWTNVDLIATPVADAPIDITADAVIFCAVHDVLQSRSALTDVFAHVRPGAEVVAIGGKWPAPWLWPLRPWVQNLHQPFIDDFTGFDEPWKLLTEFLPELAVRQLASGTGYLAHGRTPES